LDFLYTRDFLRLAQEAEFLVPVPLEFGRREAVLWVDVFIAAPRQIRAEASLRDVLLMIAFEALMVSVALRQHLVQRLQLGGCNGVEKGLHDEGFDRRAMASHV
jgi:hypothetical protein